MDQEFNFEEDMDIDKFNLDVEWIAQPGLFLKYAEAAAEAEREMNHADELVKTLRSELILEARDKSIAKNQDQAEAYYRTQPSYKDAKKALIEAEYTYNILKNSVSALHQRKMALENLVRLHSQSYFSDPHVQGVDSGEVRSSVMAERMRDRVTEKSTRN